MGKIFSRSLLDVNIVTDSLALPKFLIYGIDMTFIFNVSSPFLSHAESLDNSLVWNNRWTL